MATELTVGAAVSMRISKPVDFRLVLPAASVAVAVYVYDLSDSVEIS